MNAINKVEKERKRGYLPWALRDVNSFCFATLLVLYARTFQVDYITSLSAKYESAQTELMKVFFWIEDFGSDFIATHLLKTFHDDPRLIFCWTIKFDSVDNLTSWAFWSGINDCVLWTGESACNIYKTSNTHGLRPSRGLVIMDTITLLFVHCKNVWSPVKMEKARPEILSKLQQSLIEIRSPWLACILDVPFPWI